MTDDRCTYLERRLADGVTRITEAEARGKDVREWEAFWLDLLRAYEDACQEWTGERIGGDGDA